MDDDEGNPIRPEVKSGMIKVSSQGEATEETSSGEGIPVLVIGGIIVIIVAVSAFVVYRKRVMG